MTGIERLPKEPLPRIGLERLPVSSTEATSKLTFEQRCLGAALFMERNTTTEIAEFLGIHVSTMRHIIKRSSPHYRSVRLKAAELGVQQFIDVYISTEDRARWEEFKSRKRKVEVQAENPDAPNYAPNRSAAGKAGTHREFDYEGNACDLSIKWHEVGDPNPEYANGVVEEGWYLTYVDPGFGDLTSYGPFGTSRAAWNRWFRDNNVDKYVEPDYEKERARKRKSAEQAS